MTKFPKFISGDTTLVIRKPVYEALPYLYLFGGILTLVALDSTFSYLSGVLLYVAGALVWVMRSAYRRKNSKRNTSNHRNGIRFPEWVYEYLPFFYIGTGVAVLILIDSSLRVFPGGLLCLAGVLVWIIRAIYRSQLVYDTLS